MPEGVNLMKLKVLTKDLGVDISLRKMTTNESSGSKGKIEWKKLKEGS